MIEPLLKLQKRPLNRQRWLRRGLLAALACLPLLATAEPKKHAPTADEFAVQMPLKVSGANGVVQLLLPLAVYQHSRSAALADLRVYNHKGQAVPYALHRPSYRTHIALREQPAAMFPLYASAQIGAPTHSLDLQLRTDAHGALLTIAAPAPTSSAQSLDMLILDLGASERDEILESVSFELPDGHGDYRARIAIERSEDLKWWDGVAHDALDWISSAADDQRLVNDRIEFPIGQGRYLKIRWVEGEPLLFARAQARWRSASVPLDPRLEVTISGQAGPVEGEWVYATSPAILATSVGLDLAEANSVLPVTMGFYRDVRLPKASRQWLPRVESTFYRLTHNGQERRSSRIHIAPLSGSEWVVRPRNSGQAAPNLVLSWQPQTLVFTAQGRDFVLSVGAEPAAYAQWLGGPAPMEHVAPGYTGEEIEQLERATVSAVAPAKPTVAIVERPDRDDEARKRRWMLWSVLGLGVLVLGFMTWRLYGQISKDQS